MLYHFKKVTKEQILCNKLACLALAKIQSKELLFDLASIV